MPYKKSYSTHDTSSKFLSYIVTLLDANCRGVSLATRGITEFFLRGLNCFHFSNMRRVPMFWWFGWFSLICLQWSVLVLVYPFFFYNISDVMFDVKYQIHITFFVILLNEYDQILTTWYVHIFIYKLPTSNQQC